MLQKHCFHWGQVNSQEKLLVLERDQKRDQAKSKALEILSPKFCRYLSTSKIIRANPHPRRPRGIQSGREKSAGRKFSSTGGRAPGYRLSPNYFQNFKHMSPPDWTRNTCFVLLCPIGEQFLLSSFREFVYDDNDCLPWRSAVDRKQLIHLWSTAGLFRFFFQILSFMQIVSGIMRILEGRL